MVGKKPQQQSTTSTSTGAGANGGGSRSTKNASDLKAIKKRLSDTTKQSKTAKERSNFVKRKKIVTRQKSKEPRQSIGKKSSKSSTPATSPNRKTVSKPQVQQKHVKAKAINKILKNLDIKISGFSKILPDQQKEVVECKASISEIVKTKSRAVAAKISSPPENLTRKGREDSSAITAKPEEPISSGSGRKEIMSHSEDMKNSKITEPKVKKSSQKDSAAKKEKDESKKEAALDKIKSKSGSRPNSKTRAQQLETSQSSLIFSAADDFVQNTQSKETENFTKKEEKEIKSSLKKVIPAQPKKVQKKAPPDKKGEKACSKRTVAPKKQITFEDITHTDKDPETKRDASKKSETIDRNASQVSNTAENEEIPQAKEKTKKSQKRPAAKDNVKTAKEKKLTKKQKTEISSAAVETPEELKKNVLKIQKPSADERQEAEITLTSAKHKTKENKESRQVAPHDKNEKFNTKEAFPSNVVNPSIPEISTSAKKNNVKSSAVKQKVAKKCHLEKEPEFKTFKTAKPPSQKKASIVKVKPKKFNIGTKSEPEASTSKKEKDIYDFKTESESDDNIKMNLLSDPSIIEKFAPIEEKDFSDEDDKPLHLTKLQIKDQESTQAKDKDKKRKGKSVREKQKPPESQVKKSKESSKKTQIKVTPKKSGVKQRKNSSDSSESESDSESDVDGRLRVYKRRKVIKKLLSFPKRHRMASLNALAKVQCLYENESRTAHELGLSKMASAPKIRTINSCSSSEEEKDSEKYQVTVKQEKADNKSCLKKEKSGKEESKDTPKTEDKEDEVEEVVEEENKRELRNAPGLRGVGKHWEFNDMSSFESGQETDRTFRKNAEEKAAKAKKKRLIKAKAKLEKSAKAEAKTKKLVRFQQKRKPKSAAKHSAESSSEEEEKKKKDNKKESRDKNLPSNKRKRNKSDDIGGEFKELLQRKRMASLNASAIVAATYEVERHIDRNLDSDCSSFDARFLEDEKPKITPKKQLKDIKPEASDPDQPKETTSRPTSSSVVIVQDTDVTITGVYVNASTGSSQEAYCKMQYRVQSSVTEERVLRPSSIDPPKSYTPLGALSSMRPPGANVSSEDVGDLPIEVSIPPQSAMQQHHQPIQEIHNSNLYQSPVPINQDAGHIGSPAYGGNSLQQHHIPHHLHHQGQSISAGLSAHHLQEQHQQQQQQQMHIHHHQQHHQQLQQHYQQHHHHQQQSHPQGPLPMPPSQTMSQGGRCDSPMRYQPSGYPQQIPQPPTISMSGSGSSAFCPPIQQQQQQPHHELSGYYQPAGPLISPHVLPAIPASQQIGTNAPLVTTKQLPSPLDSDSEQLQQPPPSISTAESSDSEVLITGGDLSNFRYPTSQQSGLSSQQQHQQPPPPPQGSAYSRSMHQMHYPPAYPQSYYSHYPGDAVCYSPPYQPYFPAKVYQTAPTYRRYPAYYQPGHPPQPSDLYEAPPPHSAAPPQQPPTGSQLVPAGPTAPQHMDHYPGPPGFYSSYSPGGPGQCYPRSIQPPYMEYPAPPCPCPMQSCPKNVLTGPLIGSNSSKSSSSTILSSGNSSNNSSSTNHNITMNNNNSNNSNNSLNNTTTNSNSSSINSTIRSAVNHHQLISNKGPVSQQSQQTFLSQKQIVVASSKEMNEASQQHHQHSLHQCKLEIIDPTLITIPTTVGSTIVPPTVVKSELKTEAKDLSISPLSEDIKSSQYEETVVEPPTPPPSTGGYQVNDKLTEPEMTVSPSRGSTGLPTVPDAADNAAEIPAGAAQIRESDNSLTVVPQKLIGRKARIGKTMAREMMYAGVAAAHQHPIHHTHHLHSHSQHSHVPSIAHIQQQSQIVSDSILETKSKLNLDTDHMDNCHLTIKMEQIKIEEEDDVVCLEDEKVKPEPEIVEISDEKTPEKQLIAVNHYTRPEDIIHVLLDDSTMSEDGTLQHPSANKRMKILEFTPKGQCKKSPPNSYKSLIKQTEPKPYLCLSNKEKRMRYAKYTKISTKDGVKKRRVMLTDQQKKRIDQRKRKFMLMERRRKSLQLEPSEQDDSSGHNDPLTKTIISDMEISRNATYNPHCLPRNLHVDTSRPSPNAESADTIGPEKRGYLSDPEMGTSTDTAGRKNKKSKSTEIRSKSETKRPSSTKKQEEKFFELNDTSTSKKSKQKCTVGKQCTQNEFEIITVFSEESLSKKSKSKSKLTKSSSNKINKRTKKSAKNKKSTKNRESKSSKKNSSSEIENSVELKAVDAPTEENNLTASRNPIGGATTIHNNNNILEHNNNKDGIPTIEVTSFDVPLLLSPAVVTEDVASSIFYDDEDEFLPVPTAIRGKRARSRVSRFSNRKRRRTSRHSTTEVDETPVALRKANAIPRWNNGWSWEGAPFQGKVFLNSDDPLVIRTCYPAMRHSEGDIIRPRDCVLLRAGSKKNELPYVAKVAHLWENPEDGEMMMSLLWYYRPEHTEQGRQPNDSPDEVFASRHRDHNSVACIEDKCYVLTFSEYCRYRRKVRANEECMEEEVSIVPLLPNSHFCNKREVPVQTNPEQVMFCQRVYEFRLKRLMKTPTS